MDKLYIDCETRSQIPISSGAARYAEEATVILVAYAIADAPVGLWQCEIESMPADLYKAIQTHTLVAHNSFFDRTVFQATKLFGEVDLGPSRWIDTMVQALTHGLPAGLEVLSTHYALKEGKKQGKKLMQIFCTPNSAKAGATFPEQWAEFCEYAKADVSAMRELHKLMPAWNYPNGQEYGSWLLDQQINDRGFAIDTDLAQSATILAAFEREELNRATQTETSGQVQAATQRDALKDYINNTYGLSLPDLRASTVAQILLQTDLPEGVREILNIRAASSRNTAAKYKTALACASAKDKRIKGALQFCGASTTGRWSGRMIQPQNLMRPTMKQIEIDEAVARIKDGSAVYLYSNISEVLGNTVRSVITAEEGRKLVAADYSAIEGRSLAWLAGEQSVVDFYRQADEGKVGYDSYMLTYASVFNINPNEVTPTQRTLGKPIELSMGYGGGVSAFVTFASVYRIDLDEAAEGVWRTANPALIEISRQKFEWASKKGFAGGTTERQFAAFDYIKERWRESRPATVAFWRRLQSAFGSATALEGCTFQAGEHIKFNRSKQWLRMRLPSGRLVCFSQPRCENDELSFAGMDNITNKWKRSKIYGGKLAGLATQAFAGDIMREPIAALEDAGYPIVLSVHDELVAEVGMDKSLQPMIDIMVREKAFAKGLPLRATGFEAKTYRK